LVDIADGQDITTKAGLEAALATDGEYANIDMEADKTAVLVTASSSDSTDQHVFYATSDTDGNITVEEVAIIGNVDIDDFVAANFNIS